MGDFQITKRTIDVERVFTKKNPRMARMIPGVVFAYLRKVIHEKEVNDFLFRNREFIGLDFVDRLLFEFGARVEVNGLENLSGDGRYLIASNHPLGGLDGVALMQAVGKVTPEIVFPVNDILLFLPNLKPLFIPINKHGSNAENLKIIHQTFESEKQMLYFPAGLVSRKSKGVIRDLEWKKTFVARAKKHKRDIVPTYIDGRNTNFFYGLANWRKRLGIKANIEMLYLSDEMFKQKNKTIRISFGKPIPWTVFDKTKNDRAWAAQIKNYVYGKEKGLEEAFDPNKKYSEN